MPLTYLELARLDGIARRLRDALRQVDRLCTPERVIGPEGESVFDCGVGKRCEAFHGERSGPTALVFRLAGFTWPEEQARALHVWLGEQIARADAARSARLISAVAGLAPKAAPGDQGDQAGAE